MKIRSWSHRKLIWTAFFWCKKLQPHWGNCLILLIQHITCPKGKSISHHYMTPKSANHQNMHHEHTLTFWWKKYNRTLLNLTSLCYHNISKATILKKVQSAKWITAVIQRWQGLAKSKKWKRLSGLRWASQANNHKHR